MSHPGLAIEYLWCLTLLDNEPCRLKGYGEMGLCSRQLHYAVEAVSR